MYQENLYQKRPNRGERRQYEPESRAKGRHPPGWIRSLRLRFRLVSEWHSLGADMVTILPRWRVGLVGEAGDRLKVLDAGSGVLLDGDVGGDTGRSDE